MMGKICPKYKAALIQGIIAHTGAGSPEDIEFVNYNTKWQIKELEDLISCDFERCSWWAANTTNKTGACAFPYAPDGVGCGKGA